MGSCGMPQQMKEEGRKDNIILTGFMGCGKSSLGVKLSYYLRKPMLDTDKWIEKEQGMRIAALFERYGEEAFRQMETDCLKELLKSTESRIIATGGGLPMREENRLLLKRLGRVYYLKVTPEEVYQRLKGDTERPLLQGENPRGKIEELLGKRAPVYEQCADYVVEVSERSFEEILEEIGAREREREA